MPRTGGQVRNRGPILGFAKRLISGLYRFTESATDTDGDFAEFEIITGSTSLPDISFTAGTTVLLPAASVPSGMRCYITDLEVSLPNAGTVWSGGTAGTVSVTIEDTAGTDIITFTQAALASKPVFYTGKFNGSAPAGVTDSLIQAMGACTAVNQGIRVLTANSTAGAGLRIRIAGYFAP